MKKPKILICAYACNPLSGSESGVGWGYCMMASVHNEVWVITDEIHKADIEHYLETHPNSSIHFSYITKTALFAFTEKYFRLMPLLAWQSYFSWQRTAFALGKKLHKEHRFDIVHNLTYVGFRAPGLWHKLKIPFVWGPLGGLEQTNLKLAYALGLKCFLWFLCRNILNWRDKHLCRRVRVGMKSAEGGIISATSAIQSEVKRLYHQDSLILSEIGMDIKFDDDFTPVARKEDEPIKLIWIGRMYPGKGFSFVLNALAKLPKDLPWTLQAIGDGECKKKWQKQAKKLGFGDRIIWRGQCPRGEVLATQKESHALLISSIYELTCTTAVEALAMGIPAIAPDICGFSESVPENCGIRFKAENSTQFVDGLKSGIEWLYYNEEKRIEFCQHAKVAATKFSWENKEMVLNEVYASELK